MTFADYLLDLADSDGCISYAVAESVSRQHSVLSDFVADYGTQADWSTGVDADHFLNWLGY